MGIFNTRANDDTFELREGFEYGMNAHYDIFMESIDDDMLILESIYNHDMLEIEQNRKVAEAAEQGEDEEEEAKEEKEKVMEASVKEVFAKIKAAVQKFFKNVLSWFEGIINRIRAIAMSGEEFEKKFGSKIKDAKMSKEIKIKAYNFNTDHLFDSATIGEMKSFDRKDIETDVSSIFSKSLDNNEKFTRLEDAYKKSGEFEVYEILGKVIDSNGSDASNVDDDLFDYFYGSGAKKDGKKERTITKNMIMKHLSNLAKSTSTLKDLQKAKGVVKTEANALVRDIDKAGKEAESNNKDDEFLNRRIGIVRISIQMIKNKQTAYIRFINTWSSALGAYVNFAKSVCLAATRSK